MTAVEMIYLHTDRAARQTSILTLYLRLFPVAKFRVGVFGYDGSQCHLQCDIPHSHDRAMSSNGITI
jgi:hypothetical protein